MLPGPGFHTIEPLHDLAPPFLGLDGLPRRHVVENVERQSEKLFEQIVLRLTVILLRALRRGQFFEAMNLDAGLSDLALES